MPSTGLALVTASTEELFSQHLSFRGFRQASEQADAVQGKLLGAVFEAVFFVHNSDFALLRFEGRRMKEEVGQALLHSAFSVPAWIARAWPRSRGEAEEGSEPLEVRERGMNGVGWFRRKPSSDLNGATAGVEHLARRTL
ncbi:MAG: hypothetical protein ABIR80_21310 [Opitutaceae bacterium]